MQAPLTNTTAMVRTTPVRLAGSLVDLYPSLSRHGPGTALLETLGPPGPAVLVWDPAVTVQLDGATVRVRADRKVNLPGVPRTPAAVPGFLDRLLRRFAVEPSDELASRVPFLGGLVGFAGFEWAVGQEGPVAPTLAGFPALWFGLFDRALVHLPGGSTRLVVASGIRDAKLAEVRRQISRGPAHPLPPAGASLAGDLVGRSWGRAGFEQAVAEVRRRIRRGEVYQVNLATQLRARGIDPWELYRSQRSRNPSPFAGYLEGGGVTIASASPERVLRVSRRTAGARVVESRPIAGTRPRGAGGKDLRNERALRRSPKERAEHTMLVDLARNDVGRVAALGSVEVDEWLTVERYSHVMHLVSNVRGELDPRASLADLLRALLPGGSVTGTPKIRATEIIEELEPVPRGPYTGSLGYLSLDGRIDLNLLIRSAFRAGTSPDVLVYAGAGIVQDSRPDREWREVLAKAAALVEATSGRPSRGFPWSPPRRYGAWSPPVPSHRYGGRRVLLIDNYDSFTYNLAQYLAMLGARVRVVRNDAASLATLRAWAPTHVVLSPGPGRPSDSGVTVAAVRGFEGTPLLGVCLGHQAIVEAYGGALGIARTAVHGKSCAVRCAHDGGAGPLLEPLAPSFQAARYHSLVAARVPAALRVTARTADGTVMAVQHRRFPTFGVQFHPESFRTEGGLEILDRFLAVEPERG